MLVISICHKVSIVLSISNGINPIIRRSSALLEDFFLKDKTLDKAVLVDLNKLGLRILDIAVIAS